MHFEQSTTMFPLFNFLHIVNFYMFEITFRDSSIIKKNKKIKIFWKIIPNPYDFPSSLEYKK